MKYSSPHSGAIALIRESLISMQNMPEALYEFDRLVEQLEAMRVDVLPDVVSADIVYLTIGDETFMLSRGEYEESVAEWAEALNLAGKRKVSGRSTA